VPQAQARVHRDRRVLRTSGGAQVDNRDEDLGIDAALQRLAGLLAQYYAALPPQRRGGVHPRARGRTGMG
jgi:hypothetical protein